MLLDCRRSSIKTTSYFDVAKMPLFSSVFSPLCKIFSSVKLRRNALQELFAECTEQIGELTVENILTFYRNINNIDEIPRLLMLSMVSLKTGKCVFAIFSMVFAKNESQFIFDSIFAVVSFSKGNVTEKVLYIYIFFTSYQQQKNSLQLLRFSTSINFVGKNYLYVLNISFNKNLKNDFFGALEWFTSSCRFFVFFWWTFKKLQSYNAHFKIVCFSHMGIKRGCLNRRFFLMHRSDLWGT